MLTIGVWSAGNLKENNLGCLNEEAGRGEKKVGDFNGENKHHHNMGLLILQLDCMQNQGT